MNLRISIIDSILETLSPSNFLRLIVNLKLVQSSGLDVVLSPHSDKPLLQRALRNYRRVLGANSLGLTITINNLKDVNKDIVDLVDGVFFIPSPIVEKYPQDLNLAEITNVVPATKLLVGLPSTIFVVPTSKDGQLTTPSLLELCRGQNLTHWQPKVSIDDRVHWTNPNCNWTFLTQMGEALNAQLSNLFGISSGIVLFDIPFKQEDSRYFSKPKSLFLESIRQTALQFGFDVERRVKRGLDEAQIRMSTIETSRLGKVLIFAVGSEEEQFKRYYGIVDDESLLDSPVQHIVLGYDDGGKIYDIYQQMPQDLSHESIFNTIHQYYVDKILGGEGVFGVSQFKPPSIVIYPGASGTHPVPLLITWVRIASPVELPGTRKTRKPSTISTTSIATSSTTTVRPSTTVATSIKSSTTIAPTSPTTITSSSTAKLCSGPVPPNRCFIPNSLMNVLNISVTPTTTQATTRKPTTARQATTKPAIPMNPNARFIDPNEMSSLSYLAVSSSERTQFVATETKTPQVDCVWEPNPPFVVCKTPGRVQRSITELQHKTFQSISATSNEDSKGQKPFNDILI